MEMKIYKDFSSNVIKVASAGDRYKNKNLFQPQIICLSFFFMCVLQLFLLLNCRLDF